MKFNHLLLSLLMLVFSSACSSKCLADAPRPIEVSLIQLIANPANYHGKSVMVCGFLHEKFADSALYLSKEDADYINGRNAIWVTYAKEGVVLHPGERKIDPKSLDGKFVVLKGIFNREKRGHMSSCSGQLDSVTSAILMTRYYNGKFETPEARKLQDSAVSPPKRH